MIGAYLRDRLTILRHGARDKYGEASDPAQETVYGYVEWKTRLVRDIHGEQVASSASVLLAYDPALTHEDQVRIDDVDHSILIIEIVKDFSTRAMKVYLS